MNILHVVNPSAVGGLERVVQTLAVAQRDAGDDVRVAAVFPGGVTDDGAAFCTPLREAGIEVHPIEVPNRGYWSERAAVAELCGRHRVDVLHTHGYRCDIVNAGTSGTAHVTTAHGFTGGGVGNRVYEWLQRRAFRGFDAVVAVARPLAGRLLRAGIPRHRVHVVTNAWAESVVRLDRATARRALGAGDDEFLIGWAGRVSREKGLDVLLAALADVGNIPWRLDVLGDGRERPSLERWSRRHRIDDRVVWHGIVPAAERLFAAFDVLVLSSRTEGTPIVLFEAAGAGAPIVATRVGGIPDVVSEKEALLVPSEDPHALAAALRDVYRNPTAAVTRACAAAARIRREHGVKRWSERYRVIYESALSAAKSR